MRRDANFGISVAKIQVKEEKETDKSDISLVFRYRYCRNLRKRRREKLTKISYEFHQLDCRNYFGSVSFLSFVSLLFG